jgi:predicted nucleic acid-binding protein
MVRILVTDSNIIFSATLNIKNPIGHFLMTSAKKQIKLYAPEYLKIEIERYIEKLGEISGMPEDEIRAILNILYAQINFIPDDAIPFEFYTKALPYVRDTDMDDLTFVALADFLDAQLWTGDKRLYEGLVAKGYARVISFDDLKKEFPEFS